MTTTPGGSVEFSRTLRLERLRRGEVVRELAAGPQECAALARRFDLPAVDSLSGRLRVWRPGDGPIIRIEGRLAAEVRQTCVVTLETFASRLSEDFVQLFTLEAPAAGGEVFVSPEDEDTPEPLEGDALDLGEVLAEQLALALDPHPRKPDAGLEGASFSLGEATAESDEEDSPFAALKRFPRHH